MANSNETSVPKYRLLGNSSLRVFPLCLGTMHFGQHEFGSSRGVCCTFEEAEKLLLKYFEVGGNFIDTANFYHMGQSEEWIAEVIAKHNVDRERLVIATKYSLPMVPGDPNAAGNNKKNLRRSVRDSLKRLKMEYIDLLWVHFWDFSVNIEQLMRQLDEIVKSGQVLHIGALGFPSWVVCRANSIALQHGWTPFTAYQGRYNIGERDLEQEVFPMCKHFNMATAAYSVVGGGKFTGTRNRENIASAEKPKGTARTVTMTENEFQMQDAILEISKEINRSPSQIAVNWALKKVTTPLLGCRTLTQLEDCLGALEFDLTPEQMAKLDEAGKDSPRVIIPHRFDAVVLPHNPRDHPFLYIPQKKYAIEL